MRCCRCCAGGRPAARARTDGHAGRDGARPVGRLAARARHALRQHHRRRRSSRRSPATWRSRSGWPRSCAGTRWRWWCAPTRPMANSAATSRATPARPICSKSASTTSSARRRHAGGDLVFFQPHSAPGVYARAFLEGRLSETRPRALPAGDRARASAGAQGLSSYPHPWLMPDFWQFPTGSMGIGPISSIYQARFMRYLQHRGLLDTGGAHASGACSATARWTSRRA